MHNCFYTLELFNPSRRNHKNNQIIECLLANSGLHLEFYHDIYFSSYGLKMQFYVSQLRNTDIPFKTKTNFWD